MTAHDNNPTTFCKNLMAAALRTFLQFQWMHLSGTLRGAGTDQKAPPSAPRPRRPELLVLAGDSEKPCDIPSTMWANIPHGVESPVMSLVDSDSSFEGHPHGPMSLEAPRMPKIPCTGVRTSEAFDVGPGSLTETKSASDPGNRHMLLYSILLYIILYILKMVSQIFPDDPRKSSYTVSIISIYINIV